MPKPRKPTKLLELTGAFKRHPERKRGPEPKFAGEAICPRHLSPEAKKEWRRVAPQLRKLGLLTVVDRAALAAYCMCHGLAIEAQRDIKAHGILVSGGRKNPACGVLKDMLQLARQYAAEFGMTPSSRSKVNMPTSVHVHDSSNPFEEMAAEKYFN